MKMMSHSRTLHYHTWRDIGGVGGLCLDVAYFFGVLIAAACMLVVGTIILLLDYAATPVVSLVNWIGRRSEG